MFQHLKRIRNAGWNAIIAGGAIRDTYHDKHVSTIDVFVKAQKKAIKEMGIEFKSPKWMQYWFNMFKCSAKHQDDVIYLGDIETFEKLDRNIIAVWQVITKGKTYQIILITKDPEKYVEDNFDFGICKAFNNPIVSSAIILIEYSLSGLSVHPDPLLSRSITLNFLDNPLIVSRPHQSMFATKP